MTIQVASPQFAKSKKTLEAALNEVPGRVEFFDPSIFAGSRGYFDGRDIKPHERFPVVMDHPRRLRFAEIVRLPGGGFRVR